jgi:sugar transferase (PEP-CTERM system associated)
MFVLITRVALDAAWRIAAAKQKILVLGAGKAAHIVAHELTQRNDLNLEVAGFLNPAADPEGGAEYSRFPVLGSMDDLETVVRENQISRIVVALEDRRGSLPIRDLVRLRVGGIRVEDAHSTLAALSGRIWLGMVQPSWFIFSNGFHRSRFTLALKRMLDLSFGLLGLALSAPIMALVAAAIRLDSKGPVLYSQERVGYKGRCFQLLKFRSMREDAEAGGAQWAQKNDQRVTRIGKYLRKFRLDELPQFINVIRGEMSFVGPRPERPVFVDQLRDIISYYDERHSVRPGLTGWAQVQYAYGASIDDAFRKVEYDLFYLKNMSIVFDCVIILKTIRIVLTGRGSR